MRMSTCCSSPCPGFPLSIRSVLCLSSSLKSELMMELFYHPRWRFPVEPGRPTQRSLLPTCSTMRGLPIFFYAIQDEWEGELLNSKLGHSNGGIALTSPHDPTGLPFDFIYLCYIKLTESNLAVPFLQCASLPVSEPAVQYHWVYRTKWKDWSHSLVRRWESLYLFFLHRSKSLIWEWTLYPKTMTEVGPSRFFTCSRSWSRKQRLWTRRVRVA